MMYIYIFSGLKPYPFFLDAAINTGFLTSSVGDDAAAAPAVGE